ncbi:MAG: hypothetical protein EXR79_04730 [Myxococcales bacterium]|nr:hypothetical protein [Myxococcales bacterium]
MSPAALAAVVAVLGGLQDWTGVEFGPAQFDVTLRHALDKWLDVPEPGGDKERRAWRRAAELALWSQEPTVELLPEAYLAHLAAVPAREGGPASGGGPERWRPVQPAEPLVCQGKPVAGLRLVVAEVSGRAPKVLDAAWLAWWGTGTFAKRELRCVLDWIERRLPADDQRATKLALAWVNAASGWLKAIDRNSDVVAQRFWERVSDSDQVADDGEPGLAVEPCTAPTPTDPPAHWCVADVRAQSAAWQGDVRVYDRLLQVGDLATADQPRKAVLAALVGLPGSKVRVQLRRGRGGKPRTLALLRDRAVMHDVEAELLAPGIVHVRLHDFVRGTAGRLDAAIKAALQPRKGKPKALAGVVLDLRGNGGGVLDEAIALADQFLPAGVTVRTRWRGRSDEKLSHDDATDRMAPLVVLADRRCGSACEVLAGALQDRGRAVVLGARTFGKASMQEVKRPNLMAGYYVKVTIGRYLTPSGRDIDGEGLLPDVALPADPTTGFALAETHALHARAACVARSGVGRQTWNADPAPRRRHDAWLAMARDWLACAALVAPQQ